MNKNVSVAQDGSKIQGDDLLIDPKLLLLKIHFFLKEVEKQSSDQIF